MQYLELTKQMILNGLHVFIYNLSLHVLFRSFITIINIHFLQFIN